MKFLYFKSAYGTELVLIDAAIVPYDAIGLEL